MASTVCQTVGHQIDHVEFVCSDPLYDLECVDPAVIGNNNRLAFDRVWNGVLQNFPRVRANTYTTWSHSK